MSPDSEINDKTKKFYEILDICELTISTINKKSKKLYLGDKGAKILRSKTKS